MAGGITHLCFLLALLVSAAAWDCSDEEVYLRIYVGSGTISTDSCDDSFGDPDITVEVIVHDKTLNTDQASETTEPVFNEWLDFGCIPQNVGPK